MSARIFHSDALVALRQFPSEFFNLIYIDPPFNTGKRRVKTTIKTKRSQDGDRVGYQGKKYNTTVVGSQQYDDAYEDYLGFLMPIIQEAYRVLHPNGSFFLHLNYREVHYCKVEADKIFGRKNFINEIIWSYDYGARSKKRWSVKHDTILWWAKNLKKYTFNYEAIDRIPYMAPELVGADKAARGKTPTDVWWNTIVPTNGKEKTGYPTQKPLGILERIVLVHSNPGDRLLDFFAGSGSFGEAALKNGRNVALVDISPNAIQVMQDRLGRYEDIVVQEINP